MNYENQLKQFVQDYATALSDDINAICSIEHEPGEKKIGLYVHNKEKSSLLIEYDYEEIHGVDETLGTDNRKHYLLDSPITKISEKQIVSSKISTLFAQYCQVFSVNYIISDIPFTVKDEPIYPCTAEIISKPLSNEYREIILTNSNRFQYKVKIYLADGTCLCVFPIENISEN